MDLFFDTFDSKAAAISNAPVPTSIRCLTLDFNFLGKEGCDILGTIIASSRNLFYLSINRCRIIGKDMKKIMQSLSINKSMRVLNLG